jgi:hypothetical protein
LPPLREFVHGPWVSFLFEFELRTRRGSLVRKAGWRADAIWQAGKRETACGLAAHGSPHMCDCVCSIL